MKNLGVLPISENQRPFQLMRVKGKRKYWPSHEGEFRITYLPPGVLNMKNDLTMVNERQICQSPFTAILPIQTFAIN